MERIKGFEFCHMELKIYICNKEDQSFIDLYKTAIEKHNNNVTTSMYPDAGFDLFCPIEMKYKCGKPSKYPLGIKCSAEMITSMKERIPCGFMMFPRSSISKTSLRLANGTGIIDSGYRGELMGAFDCFYGDYTVEVGHRLLQIVAPGMIPIKVSIVDSEEELSDITERGEGGFGSTGK